MKIQTAIYPAIAVYLVVYVITVGLIANWQRMRHKQRPPLDFKLRRGPGESLRQRVAAFDEHSYWMALIGGFVPFFIGISVLQFIVWMPQEVSLITALAISGGSFLVTFVFSVLIGVRRLNRYRNDWLGYLGERAVGESLESLVAEGYRVFHDVPAEAGNVRFNVDHVAVGPNGAFAIETKTRRKGRARPGFESHKVIYDGRKLIWPWGDDSHGLRQATDRARWLQEWLNRKTGMELVVRPVLALPGWYVVPKGIGPVMVLNHRQLCGSISRRDGSTLSAKEVDLVARQLDEVCRDVED